ncbi:Coagulation factor VIII [Exaiptasia diaphana]|nr:Coagulation factor VIII [Exaiptasia diaphana]
MESKAIPDSSITASSASIPPSNARLNFDGRGWQASRTRQGEWLQVDLGKLTMVLGIGTQGGSSYYWVTSYTLKYSRDGKTFTDYESGKVLHGNSDGLREIIHELKPPIKARNRCIATSMFKGNS